MTTTTTTIRFVRWNTCPLIKIFINFFRSGFRYEIVSTEAVLYTVAMPIHFKLLPQLLPGWALCRSGHVNFNNVVESIHIVEKRVQKFVLRCAFINQWTNAVCCDLTDVIIDNDEEIIWKSNQIDSMKLNLFNVIFIWYFIYLVHFDLILFYYRCRWWIDR